MFGRWIQQKRECQDCGELEYLTWGLCWLCEPRDFSEDDF